MSKRVLFRNKEFGRRDSIIKGKTEDIIKEQRGMEGRKLFWLCWGREANVQENHNPNMKQKKTKVEQKDKEKGEKRTSRKARGASGWLTQCRVRLLI